MNRAPRPRPRPPRAPAPRDRVWPSTTATTGVDLAVTVYKEKINMNEFDSANIHHMFWKK